MPLPFIWSPEQYKLRRAPASHTLNQFEVALLAPLLQRPSAPGAGIEADDRTREIDPKALQMQPAARPFLLGQFEHIAVGPSGKTDNLRHQVLVGLCALALEIVEDAHLKPPPCGSVCRLHVPSLVKNESVFLRCMRCTGKCGAGLPCVQVDHAVEGSHLQLHECILAVIEDFGEIRVPLEQGA